MTSSKFVEIMDTTETPCSRDSIRLDDVLRETKERSSMETRQRSLSDSSTSSSGSSGKAVSSGDCSSTTTNPSVVSRLRSFSLRKGIK
ncbi:hypothetical protein LTR08_007457 [Meristemomyces frigidus]|nr:hypothetical protein LTR08_007457 [Meristemomyces frigidus]